MFYNRYVIIKTKIVKSVEVEILLITTKRDQKWIITKYIK